MESGTVALVVARFNEAVTRKLVEGATLALSQGGISSDRIEVHWVSGSWEVPLAVKLIAARREVAAVVALGAIIKGKTRHDQVLGDQVTRALMDIMLAHQTPIGLGVLTCDSLAQALERAGPGRQNYGFRAAEAAIHLLRLKQSLGS